MHQLIWDVAEQLGQIDGVVAVVLGGSRARGVASPDSDIDLGIYYDPVAPPSIVALRTLAQALDDRHLPDLATDYGAWGPWINGGAWLDVNKKRLDWLYRNLVRVEEEITACEIGQVRIDYQWGHPHGFYNHIYAGELYYCQPLFERDDRLQTLKARLVPYPPALKQAIIRTGLMESEFSLENAHKPARRGDVVHVVGYLYRITALLTQVLFAVNECYCINEKGAVLEVDTLPVHPPDYAHRVSQLLGAGGELETRLREMAMIVEEVKVLCQ